MKLDKETIAEVKDAYATQQGDGSHHSHSWTFFEERAFLENLLQTRFNFLITVYALFCNVYFLTKDKDSQIVILFLGLIITGLMWITIGKIYIKVDALLSILYELHDQFTSKMIKKVLEKNKNPPKGVNCLIGIVIPAVLVSSFVAGIICYYCR